MKINMNKLSTILEATEEQVAKIYQLEEFSQSGRPYWLKEDENAKVLGVAHLDVVGGYPHKSAYYRDMDCDFIFSRAVDDRVGAYTIGELSLNMPIDILFTTDEEIGKSTAKFFHPTKDYNWIFSFDRRGRDVVMYDYLYDEEMPDLVESVFKCKPSNGSFSDIECLTHLGVSGMNIGSGYYEEHTSFAYVELDDLQTQITKFITFYKLYNNRKLVHTPYTYNSKNDIYGLYDEYYYGRFGSYYNGKTIYPSCEGKDSCFKPASYRPNYDIYLCDSCNDEMVALDMEKRGIDGIDVNWEPYHIDDEGNLVEGYARVCQYCEKSMFAYYDKNLGDNICDDCFDEIFSKDDDDIPDADFKEGNRK
jgi:hypothetical protein